MADKIQFRRGLHANLPTLSDGEPGFETDSGELYVGDSGTNKKIGHGVLAPSSEVWITSGNGYGSNSTNVRRYLNVQLNQGTDMTLSQSGSLGDIVTINTTGIYAASANDLSTSAQVSFVITRNSTHLTTGVLPTPLECIAIGDTPGANISTQISTVLNLAAGDVIRVQNVSAGLANSAGTDFFGFRIVRIG